MILAELGRFGLYQMHKDKWNLIKSAFRTPILKDMQMAASENLSGAAILIFRRYFKSSSLSTFYKILENSEESTWK